MKEKELYHIIKQADKSEATRLNLGGAQLSELPPEIANLTNLTELDLSNNQLSTLPPEIANLTNLTKLVLEGNQLSKLPPEIANLTNLTELILSNNKFSEMPPEIANLTNLTELDLYANQLSGLPPEIANLTNLTNLALGGNQLSGLPPEIANLTNLTNLDIGSNQLSELLPEIANLTNLMKLDLGGNQLLELPLEITNLTNLMELGHYSNQLSELPPEIANLTNLIELDLGGNELSELPPEIANLTNLTNLDLGGNELSELPPEIANLTNLTKLVLEENQLSKLPPEIANLTKLIELDLGGNQLSELPPEIANLTKLTKLVLEENQLSKLPPEIANLTNLIELDLGGNQLSEMPPEMANLTKLTRLVLFKNSLPIPPEILSKTNEPETIINYYFEHIAGRKTPLNEAKMLLVGQGGVGKTSIIKRLVENEFDPDEHKTDGIDIKYWDIAVEDQKIRLNVWDFGGQEIMHATHQFFLTKRSLYILVWDVRQEDDYGRIEYWLKLIQSFGDDSPVIVVLNKVDEGNAQIDRRGLQIKYENIKAFVETSCKTRKGIDKLFETIKREVRVLKHIKIEWLQSWFNIKAYLEKSNRDYIEYNEYNELCDRENVDLENRKILINFLHDLGIMLHFHEDFRLRTTGILNPEWVTNGVYTIINSSLLAENRGILIIEHLDDILDNTRYPQDKRAYLIDMMKKFELCFELESYQGQRYLIPELLSKETPEFQWDNENNLEFQYHYNFLPTSVISRFIVRMHESIFSNVYWKNGVILSENSLNQAVVKADHADKKVFISVSGQENTKRDFLAKIRANFDHIHKTIPKIEAKEIVPLPRHPEIVVDYKHLLTLEKVGEAEFIPVGLDESVDIKKLLDGVDTEEERRKTQEIKILEDDLNEEKGKTRGLELKVDRVEDEKQQIKKARDENKDLLFDLMREKLQPLKSNAEGVKWAAIMFLDLTGFSKLPEDKNKTIEQFQALYSYATMFHTNIKEVVNTWGDAAMTCFEDPNEALVCACNLAEHLKVDKLPTRFGMAYGRVTIFKNAVTGRLDVRGDCVNEAARIEPIANPYEVLISSDLRVCHELEKNKFEFTEHKRALKKGFGEKKASDEIKCYSVLPR
jgi:small GTP-binding protein